MSNDRRGGLLDQSLSKVVQDPKFMLGIVDFTLGEEPRESLDLFEPIRIRDQHGKIHDVLIDKSLTYERGRMLAAARSWIRSSDVTMVIPRSWILEFQQLWAERTIR